MRHRSRAEVPRTVLWVVLAALITASGAACANAIIPYMVVPWGQALLLPLVALAEAPFVRRHLGGGFALAAWHSLLANLASTVVGAALYFATMPALGEPLFRFWSKGQFSSGAIDRTLVVSASFAGALWLVSCVVETLALTLLRKPADSWPIWRACIQANTLTYAVLLAIAVSMA